VNSSDDPPAALARRLRALREEGLAGRAITQSQLAEALSRWERASVPLISSWESRRNPKVPPENRIEAYATFFATVRSVTTEPFHLIDVAEFTAKERARHDALLHELTLLRTEAVRYLENPGSPMSSLWHFPANQDVTIICATLPDELQQNMPYANPESPDYVKLYRFTDLDALLELHGHIRSINPASHVNIRTPDERMADAYTAHLVVLGGVDWNPVTRDLLRRIELPIRQLGRDEESDIGGFEVVEHQARQLFKPDVRTYDDEVVLFEDIAHFYRGPNPFNKKRTVTICNGMFGRGTYGAVRAVTDARFRDRNEEYVKQNFAGSDRFSILSRVYIVSGEVVTPDWTLPEIRLHEWPKESSEPSSTDPGIPRQTVSKPPRFTPETAEPTQ
jgi:hypothetical protein